MNRWEIDSFPNKELAKVISDDIKRSCQYRIHPLFGWRLLPNQKYRTLEINNRGLRSRVIGDSDSQVRCLILGRSVAWGFGSSSNYYTPAYLLEDSLREDYGLNISVINFADQVYSNIEEIKSFVFSVESLKPSYVICITGYNDIGRGYKGDKYKQFGHKELAFLNWGIESGLINGLSIATSFRGIFLRLDEKRAGIFRRVGVGNSVAPDKILLQKLLSTQPTKIKFLPNLR